MSTTARPSRPRAVRSTLSALALLLGAGGALADDRDLFRAQGAAPYLFILMDTSGSMNWDLNVTTNNSKLDEECSGCGIAAAIKEVGLHGSGDDARARAYLAKSAIYEVVKNLPESVRVGFAHFGQPGKDFYAKHWVYRINYPSATRPGWFGTVPYPDQGHMIRFGPDALPRLGIQQQRYGYLPGNSSSLVYVDRSLYQDGANNWFYGNYSSPDPPDTSASYRWNRLNHYPKLGASGATATSLRFRHGGQIYQINWRALAVGEAFGASTLRVTANLERWQPNAWDPNTGTVAQTWPDFTFDLVPFQSGDLDGVPFVAGAGAGQPVSRNTDGSVDNSAGEVVTIGYATLNMSTADQDFNVGSPCPNYGWEDNRTAAFPAIPDGTLNVTYGSGTYYYATYADPTTPSRGLTYARGDMIPWDWKNHPVAGQTNAGFSLSNRDEFMRRLAPNVFVKNGAGAFVAPTFSQLGVTPPTNYTASDRIPDFRIARYFQDTPNGSGQLQLKAEYASTPPIAFYNGTPITDSLRDFAAWHNTWKVEALMSGTGDPAIQCRERYLVVLTDGVANCNENLTAVVGGIRTDKVRTFAVGFGPAVSGVQLQTIADAGGTGLGTYYAPSDDDPTTTKDCHMFRYVDRATNTVKDICPLPGPDGTLGTADDQYGLTASSKDALVNALLNLVEATNAAPTSFASAAVPTAQIEAQDSIFLTSFLPVDVASTWPGTINHFVRPLPLKLGNNGKYFPDESRRCVAGTLDTSCFAWNAKVTTLTQAAPLTATIDADLAANNNVYVDSYHKVGYTLANGRRVLYSPAQLASNVPMPYTTGAVAPPLSLFKPQDPASLSDAQKQAFLLSLNYTGFPTPVPNANMLAANKMLLYTLATKIAPDPTTEGATNVTWLLGDVFHSDPVVVGPPTRFDYMRSNLYAGTGETCGSTGSENLNATGYRCFFEQQRLRRKVLVVGANDGQLHAFDAGTFKRATNPKPTQPYGTFDSGTGNEVFSVVPRGLIDSVKAATVPGAQHAFRFDGTVRTDDVFIDTIHQGNTSTVATTIAAADRRWRTVALAGYREGGKGYVAVDITHPDETEVVKHGGIDQYVPKLQPDYVPSCSRAVTAGDACGSLPYPMILWEFEDRNNAGALANDDGGAPSNDPDPDLGSSWSTPNTGRIRVTEGGTDVDKFVAIFGGGLALDGSGSVKHNVGNWLYMVDIETGKAIYKRKVEGAIPSEPAAVDTDFNGYLDTVYLGTTLGFLYKVDISAKVALNGNALRPGYRWIDDSKWDPFKIFDAGGRPIYYPPSVAYVAKRNDYAVLFTTGNREDIFDKNNVQGRFYAFRDADLTATSSGLPFDDGDLVNAPLSGNPTSGTLDEVVGTGQAAGYKVPLAADERGIGKVYTIAGVTVFATFVPTAGGAAGGTCTVEGVSRIYTQFTNGGTSLDPANRFYEVEGFVSNPYTENSATSETTGNDPTDSQLDSKLKNILDMLKQQLPGECKYSNVTINLKTVRSDTGVEFIAPLPVCQMQRNWKEF